MNVYYHLKHDLQPWKPHSHYLKAKQHESECEPFCVQVEHPHVRPAVVEEVKRRFGAPNAQVLGGEGTQQSPFEVRVAASRTWEP